MISYVYRVSFPSGHYYIGVKKGEPEKTQNYIGSPKKNKWMWDQFPILCKEVLWETETFERALEVEENILNDLNYHNDVMCLNANSGGRPLGLDHVGENNPFFGRAHTEERNQRHSQLMSGKGNPFYGKTHGPETRQKLVEAWVERRKRGTSEETIQRKRDAAARWPTKECPHCGVTGRGPNMTRYHFENCKSKE